MATIVVTSLSDTIAVDGVVTLREAIEAANTNAASGDAPAGSAGGDTIVFAVSGTIALGSSLSITENLVIDGGNAITLDGNNLTRPMTISNGADVTLKGLTVQNGYFAGAGGGINAGAGSDLTVINSTFSGNSGLNGGAIFAQGTLTAVNSTFDNNSAHGVGAGSGGGGAIASSGANSSALLINTTLANNSANVSGGAIFASTALVLKNSTVSGNDAATDGDGIYVNPAGTLTLDIPSCRAMGRRISRLPPAPSPPSTASSAPVRSRLFRAATHTPTRPCSPPSAIAADWCKPWRRSPARR